MNKTIYLLVLMMCMLFSACCEEVNKSELRVSPSTLTIPSTGGSNTFLITSNTSWTVSCDNPEVSLSPTSGSKDGTIQVSLKATTSVEKQQYKVLVKTNDGQVLQNVIIEQEGRFISQDVTLQVTNYSDIILFGGAANSMDSLRILSNVPWQIKGPEWIEAWNGSRWVALSQSRANVQGDATTNQDAEGTKILRLRAKSSNTSNNDRYDFITITPTYEGDAKVELTAYQLGMYSVQPNVVIALSDGLACDWECGAGIKQFAINLSDKRLTDSEIINSVLNWSMAEPNYITSWWNLKENTIYYLNMVGIDKSGNYCDVISETAFQTGTSQAQALASIENPTYADSKWSWQTKMNEYCKGYYMWVTTNNNFFNTCNAELAWYMAYWTHDEEILKNNFPMYYKDDSFSLTTEYHILIVTWAAGHNLNHPSYLIDRYCSYDNVTASSRKSDYCNEPICNMNSLDVEGFMKSFTRIK